MRVLLLAAVLPFAVLSWPAFAKDTHGVWLGTFGTTSLSDKVSLWQEFQLRHNLENNRTNQSLFRFGVLSAINSKQEWGLLYGFIRTGSHLTEHRLAQQFIFKPSRNFLMRYRLEQRITEERGGMNLRGRALFRGQVPLNTRHSFVLWDEIFLHFTNPEWVQDHTLDRNRLFAGIRTRFNKFSVEWGYMNQFTWLRGENLSEHLAVVYLVY